MLDIKTGENYRAAAERLQTERDEARAALESFAHYVREHSNEPALVANAERVLKCKEEADAD